MKIVKYEEKWKDDIRRICIDTASPDNKVNQQHHDFTLLMYCDAYLNHEMAYVLLDDHDIPQGYVLCAKDYRKFAHNIQPYLEKIRKDCPQFAQRADISMYEPYKDSYPAHLHIDIEEQYTGGGNGSKLIHTLLEDLKQQQVKGVMLGVDKHNTRAVSFYKKMGFTVLEEDEYGASLGLIL